jgi:hypothetical protein
MHALWLGLTEDEEQQTRFIDLYFDRTAVKWKDKKLRHQISKLQPLLLRQSQVLELD